MGKRFYIARNLRVIYLKMRSGVRWRLMAGETMISEGTESTRSRAREKGSQAKKEYKTATEQPEQHNEQNTTHPWRIRERKTED